MPDWSLQEMLTREFLGGMLRSAILLLVGLPAVYLASRWLRRHMTSRGKPQQGLIVGKVVLYLGVLAIVFSELNELGFKLTHILASATVMGVAMGFAAQTSFSNIISGLFLIGEQPFVVGDMITVGGTTGEVLSIDLLSVKLRTFENRYVRIPNETLLKSEVTNITHFPIRRLSVPVGVAYKEDVARVKAILLEIADRNPLCLQEPGPEVRFEGFGSSAVDLTLLVWVERTEYMPVKYAIQEEIKRRFDEEGIEIPFPHVSVYQGSASKPFAVNVIGESRA